MVKIKKGAELIDEFDFRQSVLKLYAIDDGETSKEIKAANIGSLSSLGNKTQVIKFKKAELTNPPAELIQLNQNLQEPESPTLERSKTRRG